MTSITEFAGSALLVGAGATALLDLAAMARRDVFGTPCADYALVGRWIANMPGGRFRHASIAAAPPMEDERLIGWAAHYATGILFAGLMLAAAGPAWLTHPTLCAAMVTGIASVAAPFLIMQPGMGQGIAARRTPNPRAARLRALTSHAIFGLGLYAAGWATHGLAVLLGA